MADATREIPAIESPLWRSFAPSWPLLVAIAAFLKALANRTALLNDPDTYLHIGVGRWMLIHHAIPAHDPFSNSMPGAPWVVHEWLSEIVMALAYGAFAWWGLVLLTAVLFALTLALLTRWLLGRVEPVVALVIVLLGAMLMMGHVLARPHWLAAPVMVAWCAGIVGARDRGRVPSLALLPLMMLWANLHGGFMVGIVLVLFGAGEAVLEAPATLRLATARSWGGFVVLALLAATVTPNGVSGLMLPFQLVGMTVMQQHIQEWQALDFQNFQPFELWLITLIAGGYSLGLRLPALRLLLICALTHLALAHSRYIDLVAMIAPLAIAAPMGPQLAAHFAAMPASAMRRWFGRMAAPAGRGAAALTAALVLSLALISAAYPLVREDRAETPAAALAAAEKMQLRGPVFNSYHFGGFLLFQGIAPFIDGRMEMYGDAFLANFLAAASGEEGPLGATLARYGIGWTLLQPSDGAVAVLDRMPGWRRAYADAYAIIHVRAVSPTLGSQG